ncbi:hypothetical protein bas27_0145 [Escherichia phage TrudiGerster]|uniref:Uncharacterized protein n=1 Tax=Escherichia phage TrudiGerster TaxID=2851991 RepID=A0AAE8B5H9_9CAUD|nr:hypothetical protein bas27_0145 [Escherichia phage TrudiGerster]
MKEAEINEMARVFVVSYMQGSCNSLFDSAVVFQEELAEKGIHMEDTEIEDLLMEAASSAEVFLCDNCGWWCPEHDRSEEGSYCSDCEGEE